MILVTGGAGYIGSHTVLALNEAGARTLVLDNFSRGHRDTCFGSQTVEGDLRDQALLKRIFLENPIEAVIHFAAHSQVGESMNSPETYYENNIGGSLNLLRAMREAGVKDLVFSSSASVYGEPEAVPIEENARLSPTSVYGETKLMTEKMLTAYCRAYGFRAAALRYFNAAGCDPQGRTGEDHTPETHLIPLVLDVALGKRDRISVFGSDYHTPDGTCIRDYVHVTDLAAAHVLALEKLRRSPVGFRFSCNLGSGAGYSVQEILKAAREVTGAPIPAVVTGRRPGDPAILIASSELAVKELGWKPCYASIGQIVATAWAWHKKRFAGA